MTQSIPAHSKASSDEGARQRLMELVEAEDAANGEVGCGRKLDKGGAESLRASRIFLDVEGLKQLLREHLGHILMELDFDAITTRIEYQFELLIIQPHQLSSFTSSIVSSDVLEYIPTAVLSAFFQSHLAELYSEDVFNQLLQFSHQVIHQAVLQPRYTWPKPIWVLKATNQIYIAQAESPEEAIAQVRSQYPQEGGALTVIKAGGILAPDQVISLSVDLV